MNVGNGCLANGGLPDYHGHGGKDHHEDQPQLLDLYGDSHHDTHDWRSGKQMLAEWLPGSKPQNGRSVRLCSMLTSLDLAFVVCRPPGLVQSVLAPVIGLSSLNLAYSPGAKRIDVMARCEHVYSEKQESL